MEERRKQLLKELSNAESAILRCEKYGKDAHEHYLARRRCFGQLTALYTSVGAWGKAAVYAQSWCSCAQAAAEHAEACAAAVELGEAQRKLGADAAALDAFRTAAEEERNHQDAGGPYSSALHAHAARAHLALAELETEGGKRAEASRLALKHATKAAIDELSTHVTQRLALLARVKSERAREAAVAPARKAEFCDLTVEADEPSPKRERATSSWAARLAPPVASRAPKPAGDGGSGSRQPLSSVPQPAQPRPQPRPPPPGQTGAAPAERRAPPTGHIASATDRVRPSSQLAEPRRSAAGGATEAGAAAGAKRARGGGADGASGAQSSLSGAVRPVQIACKYPLSWVPPQPALPPPPPRLPPPASLAAAPPQPQPSPAAAAQPAAQPVAAGPQCTICTQLLYRPVIAYKCDPAHVHTFCLKCVLTSVALRGPDHTCPNCRAARSEQMLMLQEWWEQIRRDHPDEVQALAPEHEAFLATHNAAAKLAKSRDELRARMEGLRDELADKDAYFRRLDDELRRGPGELQLCACKCVCIQQTFTSPAHMWHGRRYAECPLKKKCSPRTWL